jgi:hypothetical protein
MAEPPTCGEGIAANADLPARLADLVGTLADVFERHLQALDPAVPASQPEYAGYEDLARGCREVAAGLTELADQMAGYRGLPDGVHDIAALSAPGGQGEAFARYLEALREVAGLLDAKLRVVDTLG